MKSSIKKACLIFAAIFAAALAGAQPSYKFLPTGFVPNYMSADGKTITGAVNSKPAYYREASGVVLLPSTYANDDIFAVSGDGSIILGNQSSWVNGVRYPHNGFRISDDGLYRLDGHTIKGPNGTVTLQDSSYDLYLRANMISPDGKIAFGSWDTGNNSNTAYDRGGIIYNEDGSLKAALGGESYVTAVTLHGDQQYMQDNHIDRETGQGDLYWSKNSVPIKSIKGEKWTHYYSVARDNSLASDGRDIYLPYRPACLPLSVLLAEFNIANLTTGLTEVDIRQISGDGLVLLGSGKNANNVVVYWLAHLDLHGKTDNYNVVPNQTFTSAAPGVISNEIFSLGAQAVLVGSASHGTLSLATDGGFTYTPAANFVGADHFTYKLVKGAVTSASIVVQLHIGAPASLDSPPTLGAGSSGAGKVTMNFTAFTNQTVALKSSKTDVATVPDTVVVAAGKNFATFLVKAAARSSSAHTTISASFNTVTIANDLLVAASSPKSLAFDAASYCGGNGIAPVGTVILWSGAPADGLTVNLSSSNPALLSVPATVRIGAGHLSNKFSGATHAVNAPTQVTVTAASNGTSATATVTVRPPTLKSVSFPEVIRSGSSAKVLLTMDGVNANPNNLYDIEFFVDGTSAGVTSIYGNQTDFISSVNVPVVATQTTFNLIAKGEDGTTISVPMVVESALLTGFTGRTPTINGGLTAIADLHYDGKPAKTQPITYESSNTAVIPKPGNTGGAMAKSIVTNAVSATFDVTVSATFEGVTQSYVQRVIPAQLNSLTVSPSTAQGGTHLTGVVQLLGLAAASARVGLTSSDPSVIPLPTSTSVAAGKSVQTFDIPTNPVSSSKTVTITATYRGVQRTATVTITP